MPWSGQARSPSGDAARHQRDLPREASAAPASPAPFGERSRRAADGAPRSTESDGQLGPTLGSDRMAGSPPHPFGGRTAGQPTGSPFGGRRKAPARKPFGATKPESKDRSPSGHRPGDGQKRRIPRDARQTAPVARQPTLWPSGRGRRRRGPAARHPSGRKRVEPASGGPSGPPTAAAMVPTPATFGRPADEPRVGEASPSGGAEPTQPTRPPGHAPPTSSEAARARSISPVCACGARPLGAEPQKRRSRSPALRGRAKAARPGPRARTDAGEASPSRCWSKAHGSIGRTAGGNASGPATDSRVEQSPEVEER